LGFVTELFNHYGYIVLYIALTLELIFFPIPGETLMTYCGFLVFQGKLNWIISVVIAASGVMTGITISYIIGWTLGESFFKKYGSYIHFGPEKLENTSNWFKKYGNGLLIIAYFIPGVRHITGYFSGATKIHFKRFAINAYIGAFLWTGTFISLGKILGSNWEKFHGPIKKYMIIGGIITAIFLICIYSYRSYKQQIVKFVVNLLKISLEIFQSLGRIKIAILGIAAVFIGLSILVAGLIQDLLANEFIRFDTITDYLINSIFFDGWSLAMKYFSFLTYYPTLIFVTIFLTIWIFIRGKDRHLELRFLLITILGGEFLEELLRVVFHRLGPLGLSIVGHSKYTFPSEQSLMAVVTYGFAAFILLRHITRKWIATISIFIVIIICFLSGLSPLFFQLQYPSDVSAGYVFGGVWLSLNIILLEVFRILPSIKHDD
jgi:membrane protein DedA with SNARE-associated domain